ncbi:toll/interleukin-1 receptor (TIR) domain-containing protein [Artemisia annua]|uniref:Toll/interleukin-1 receptor (TIR) domain-containing protein n=1 Tax=Artemisia annua TaxID=35608 RepID=A0A2U1NXL4_ARTAN|nr:toll/interleukin-1 receptor (TIR) domain-containing protein [Artemisia annua]
MSFSNIRFSSDPSSITSLGIMLMLTLLLMVFIHYYFYSMASSSNSTAPKEEKSSSNSSEPKTMVSTSTSSIQNSFKYDVFLSFRGEDTRKNFVDHLYHALMGKGIFTYRDDENIQKGKRIRDDLFKSIEDSKFYIIVFSKNYASSSWCMDELVKIMECQTMNEHTAYPVFYDVEPTEVRKQTGAVGDAFAKHKDEKAARKWREALKEASDLAGFELKSIANGHEAKFIQKIVEEISLELRFINSSIDGNLIGMETRVNEILSSLEPGVGDVRMLGIWGMGGAGKTTLARAIFDQISIQFEGESFIENVREVSKASSTGLKKLQKQLLSDVLKDQNIKVSSVSGGKSMMQKMMRGRKVLVVLDDVDHKDQLEALAGDRNWFKPGSRIIITTRDEQVLVAHRVSLIHNVTLLSQAEAGYLFSRYAFGRENPIQGYEELSGKVLQYADGLPLTIKVMGSSLCGQSERYWIDAIERLKTIPLKETLEKLEISFDGLEVDFKEIFLDVACILKGYGKNYAIRVLESRGFHAEVGLRVLEQKSLITYNEHGKLGMHDHLEEMGRNIVRRKHPEEPNKHSRLWIQEEIEDILVNDLGTQKTKCLYSRSLDLSAEIAIKGLAKMKDLRFISVGLENENNNLRRLNPKFDNVKEYLPSSLRYMKWIGFPFSSLPNTFQGKNLVGLDIHGSNIVQLWEDGEGKVLYKLRFLRIGYSKLRTFDLRLAPNLEQLTIDYCKDFGEFHIPADHHSKLEYLNIRDSKLTNLHLGNTLNLKKLILRGGHLVEFQMPAQSLKLESFDLSHSKLINLHFKNSPNLKNLTLEYCSDLVELQMPTESLKLEYLQISNSKLTNLHLGNTPNLKILILDGCNDLVELQMPAESLKLEHLDLTDSKLKTLHLGSTPNLEKLNLEGCNDLVELKMPDDSPKLQYFNLRHSKLNTLHLESTPNLETLILEGCNDLVEFQMSAESVNLKYLKVSHSKLKTLHLGSTPNLEKLLLDGCNDLIEFQMPAESLKLEELYLSPSKLRTLDLGLTQNLKSLNLENCYDLVEINAPVGYLKKLAFSNLSCCGRFKSFVFDKWSEPTVCELHLNAEPTDVCLLNWDNDSLNFQFSCYLKEDPASPFGNFERLTSIGFGACRNHESFSRIICSLQGIKKLTLEGSITEAPQHLDQLECLEELTFSSTEIKYLPDSICKLKHLKSFKIKSCWLLEKLPDDIGRLESLEKLILTNCKLLQDIPNSICKMKCINSFELRGCIRVIELPEDIGCLEGLKQLNIEGTGITRLPDSICKLKHLESFKIKSCWLFEKLPEDIGRLESLEKLILTDCKLLQDIPNIICKMKCINKLSLRGCIRVVELPEDIGCLEGLKKLNIEGTGIAHLPQSIFQLRAIRRSVELEAIANQHTTVSRVRLRSGPESRKLSLSSEGYLKLISLLW